MIARGSLEADGGESGEGIAHGSQTSLGGRVRARPVMNDRLDEADIAAVASPPAPAPRGLVRLSGDGVLALLDAALEAPCPRRRGVSTARIRPIAALGAPLPAVLLVMPAPASFTGEDAAELAVPGNPWLLAAVVDGLIERSRSKGGDLRRAHPGEFAARAFLRGRIDLSRAEGLAASIAARTDAELAAARSLREGALAREGEAAADAVGELLGLLEAGIDFADEEDVVAISARALAEGLAAVGSRLRRLLDRSIGLESIGASPRVVLAGPPNAGKSSLFNALLGTRRTVTAPVAGTTRDAVAAPLVLEDDLGAVEVLLVDVAGEEEGAGAGSPMEAAMRRRAASERARATVVLRCHPPEAGEVPQAVAGEILVLTKSDLLRRRDAPAGSIAASAATAEGIPDLRRAIAKAAADGNLGTSGAAELALSERHRAAIARAASLLAEAEAIARSSEGDAPRDQEIVASLLREALDALGTIGGRLEPDEVLGRIFARFCIGK